MQCLCDEWITTPQPKTLHLPSREVAYFEAVALVAVDGDVPVEVVATLAKLEGVRDVVPLRF